MKKTFIGFLILSFTCKSQTKTKEDSLVINFLNQRKICFLTYQKKKECLRLKDKNIYIFQNKTLYNIEFFLQSNNKCFLSLSENKQEVLKQLKRQGDTISLNYGNLEFNIANSINKASILVYIYPTVYLDSYKYVFLLIQENKYKTWGIKLKIKENKVIAYEIFQILD